MKKCIQYLLISLILSVASTATTRCGEPFDFDDAFDSIADFANNQEHLAVRANATDSAAILNIVNANGALDSTLINGLYLRTNPLRRKTLSSLPLFQTPHYQFGQNLDLFVTYNQTYAGHYHKDKDSIDSAINFNQTSIIETVDQLGLDEVDIPDIISLFRPIKSQEHKLAWVLNYANSYQEYQYSFTLPFVYQVNTFFLTMDERKRIRDVSFSDPQDEWAFARQHLISDKLGIADLQISVERLLKEGTLYRFHGGIDITVPTAFAFKKGIMGRHYNKKNTAPSFSIHDDLLSPYGDGDQQTALINAEKLAFNVIDRMTTIFVENELGNDGHFGVGVFARGIMDLRPNITLTSKTKFEVLLPAHEQRFMIQPIKKSEMDVVNALPDGDNTEAIVKLNELSALAKRYFFPESFKTQVFPGFIIQSTSKLSFHKNQWTSFIGNDFWFCSKEKFLKINAPTSLKEQLNIQAAKRGYALSSTIFIGVEKRRPNSDWDLGVVASFCPFTYGIGGDYSLSFTLAREF